MSIGTSSIMKKFINAASDLTYKRGTIPMDKAWQTDDGEWHWNDEDIVWDDARKEMRVAKVTDAFCARIPLDCKVADENIGYIFYDFNRIENNNQFRIYWTRSIPMLKGFANITLILLHELGHFETNDEVRKYFSHDDRDNLIAEIENSYTIELDDETYIDIEAINEAYFELPDEYAASMWGFNWLADPEHRKIAKAFEKEFFACFATK